MEKDCHKLLKQLEAEKLRAKGYEVELEKELTPKGMGPCRVDIFAQKDGEILVVECGYLDGLIRRYIIEEVGKFLWIPYIRQWCRKKY